MKRPDEQTVVSIQEVLLHFDRDRYMDKRGAAEYTSLSVRNLESHLDEIPHFRVGNKILFKKSELDRWMEAHRESTQNLDRIAEEAVESLKE